MVQKAAVRLIAALGLNDWLDEITGIQRLKQLDWNDGVVKEQQRKTEPHKRFDNTNTPVGVGKREGKKKKERGLRVLSLDGGGMKGLAALKLIKEIEKRTGKKIWQLFDVVGGTSTGGMLAVALGIKRYSVEDCEYVYRELGQHIFKQGKNNSNQV